MPTHAAAVAAIVALCALRMGLTWGVSPGACADEVAPIVATFFPGGGSCVSVPGGESPAVQRLLVDLGAQLGRYRAPGTWTTYAGPWRKAWAFVAAQLRQTHRVAVPTVAAMVERRYLAWAHAMQVYNATKGVSSLAVTCGAINFACSVNGQPPIMNDFPMKMLKGVARRQRGQPPKKMHELRSPELRLVIAEWGFRSGAGWRRQMALFMALGRQLLGRFSDIAVLRCDGMVFFDTGVLFCVARRKNEQGGKWQWIPLYDAGGQHSVVALLRRHLTDLGFVVPLGTKGGTWLHSVPQTADVHSFLMRPLVRSSTRTMPAFIQYTLGDGGRSLCSDRRTGYTPVLRELRHALRACCGYSEAQACGFGTQSMRRGGDTALFESGMPQERRQLLGMWRTPTVELSYIGFTIKQSLSWAKRHAL